ncbi:MAG: SDR family NAD(P)-dependent oxidoreductase [Candidatus Hodarchaeales archaeon]|jgi:NAD(P)-dependent dehydrogenase (short-subunit alcohol dehydrogenase family)
MGVLDGKVAVITGGSRGIGRSIALTYAEAGANVVVASRTQKYIDRVADKIKALGPDSLAVATDVCIPDQVDNLVKQTVDHFGRLDIMVNNAGRGIATPPQEISIKEWNDTIALNLTGVFLGCIAAGKVMIKQKQGKIINIASTAGVKYSPNMIHYSVAKAGVISLTNNLAASWAEHNINVNCIAPGLTATKGVIQWGVLTPDMYEEGTTVPRLLRPPVPKNIADLALFLASSASDLITGELLIIRGHFPMDR